MEQHIDADSKNVALSRKTSRNTNRVVIQVRYQGSFMYLKILIKMPSKMLRGCKGLQNSVNFSIIELVMIHWAQS